MRDNCNGRAFVVQLIVWVLNNIYVAHHAGLIQVSVWVLRVLILIVVTLV